MLTKQEVSKLIAEKLDKADDLLQECVALADEHGVMFSLPWGGEGTSQRGMGADYVPGNSEEFRRGWYDDEGWQPSAHSC